MSPHSFTLVTSSELGANPPAIIYAIVEAIVPDGAKVDVADHWRAIYAAAAFLHGELAQLPPRLRRMFSIGMWGFRTITTIWYGRGFCRLPLAKRRAWIRRWAWGPIPLTRHLFRPVRSIALLAYRETLVGEHSLPLRRAA